jgi:outer membrane receptor protein involved in Fe transport
VEYDTLTTFEVGGELTYRINEKLHVVGAGVFRSFTTRSEAFAWQRPNFEVNASGFYQLQHKLIFKAQLHLLGPQRAKGYKAYVQDDPEAVDVEFIDGAPVSVVATELKPIIDASIGAEYRYTERLSGFINLNNVLVQRYQRWNQYPVQRFNVMAGLTYLFWKE